MYTTCPECETAFRVTAEVLQKAGGRVRCGSCGHAFSAIEYLSEQLPGSGDGDDNPDGFTERSNALLETLDKLAGDDNVRIEDTGTEWRVLEDGEDDDEGEILYQDTGVHEQVSEEGQDALDSSGAQSALDLSEETPEGGERRYDDNTILPDDFQDEEDIPYSPPIPKRRASDEDAPDTDFGKFQVDLELGKDGDWEDLLDDDAPEEVVAVEEAPAEDAPVEEVAAAEEAPAEEPVTDDEAEPESDIDSDLIRELEAAEAKQIEDDSAILPQLSADPDTSESGSIPADIDTQFNLQALAMGLDISRNDEIEASEDEDETEDVASEDDQLLTAADLEALTLEEPPETADEEPEVVSDDEETQNRELDAEIDDEEELEELLADEEEQADEDADEIEIEAAEEAEEEAISDSDIVGKLRESTGSFQKQIAAAQQALEEGDDEPYSDASEEDSEELKLLAEDAEEADEADDDETIARDLDEEDEDLEEAEEELELEAEDELEEEASDEDVEEEAEEEEELEAELEEEGDEEELEEEQLEDDEPETDEVELEDEYEEETESEAEVEEESEEDLAAAEEMDPEDLLSQTMIQAGIDPSALEGDNVETIVMEGEFVRGSIEKERLAEEAEVMAQFENDTSLADTYMLNKGKLKGGRRRGDPASNAVIGIVVALALLLVAQYIHASRESLVEYGAFNQTIGPVYRALGSPITPQWDIKGWQFRKTDGSVDETGQLLTISSRIQNTAEKALPYPLVHVSLTDRWEEIIGSRVLDPADYLAGDLDPSQPVNPGDEFTAVIAIESPAPEATGYKVNVCYRVDPERVRCATEDFKKR